MQMNHRRSQGFLEVERSEADQRSGASLILRRTRQLDAHLRAALCPPYGPNRPLVRLDDPRGDREAQAEAARRALRPGPIRAIEALEDVPQIRLGNAGSR